MISEMQRVNLIFRNKTYQLLLRNLDDMEKDRFFCRHTIEHFLDTARIMYIISLEEKLLLPKDIIYAAALLHDIGRVMQYKNNIPHDRASAELAGEILPQCGFDKSETEQIQNAILSHRTSKADEENNILGWLLYRADKMSRLCFCCRAEKECYWDKSRKNSDIVY